MGSRKLNIGIFLSSSINMGGGFQYERRVTSLLLQSLNGVYNISCFALSQTIVDQYEREGVIVFLINSEQDLIEKYSIDLNYFLSPSPVSAKLIKIPYILTVWDLCHRDFSEFPEVRENLEFEKREDFYSSHAMNKAVAIIVESELGKKNLIKRYGTDDNRIYVLKQLPRLNKDNVKFIDIKLKYQISGEYIFYPAQFWSHKNHIYILKALKILKDDYGIVLFAVFSGTDYGNLNYILEKAVEFDIISQIKYVGFVDDEEIPSLYKQSIALVMPTYFGPTNIPPLEAFMYDTPVFYSDLEGLREQVGDAAFLMNLRDPKSLVYHLLIRLTDPDEVQRKILQGRKVLNSWKEDDFLNGISNIFNDFEYIRECWA